MKFRHLLPSLAVLSLLGAAAVTSPVVAADAPTANAPTANAPAADAPAAAKATAGTPAERADQRIKELHDSLQITPDQEAKFNKLADVMRDNAKQMSAAVDKRHEAKQTASALDDLKAYQAITQVHADGLKALIPAFEDLYGTLSDTQKATADNLFKHGMGSGKHRKKAT